MKKKTKKVVRKGTGARKKTTPKKSTSRPKPTSREKSSQTTGGKRGTGGGGERLHKYIAGCGHCSRRRAEILIEKGLVKVNGKVVSDLGHRITPGKDQVSIHGEAIVPPEPVTVILNKPAGYITSTHDTHERLTVMDLLPRKLTDAGILPAGRLDKDTEGLLVLTNDGDLQHRITHPRYECEKEYKVLLNRPPSGSEQERLEKGVFLEELQKETADARILRIKKRASGHATLHIFIREGMKRQVRRMFESFGMKVLHLERLGIAGVGLSGLARGEWRKATPKEVWALRGGVATPRRGKKKTRSANPRKKGPARRRTSRR